MSLREPKKKRRVKLTKQPPFPISLGDKDKWTTYTAYLRPTGSSIFCPEDMIAVHSMGFFGKGSLSRGFPVSAKKPCEVIKHSQWKRRQEWEKQFDDLTIELADKDSDSEEKDCEEMSRSESCDKDDVTCLTSPTKENMPDIIEIDTKSATSEKKQVKQQKMDKVIEVECSDLNSIDDNVMIIDTDEQSVENPENVYYYKNPDSKRDNNEELQNKLLVLPDSDSETENYLKEIKPKIEYGTTLILEALHLTQEETFFLMYGLGCLNLIDYDGNDMSIGSTWNCFCRCDKYFIPKYVVYHYFRSKGWVVKYGLKYGGDFLLYKEGPPFYHASYIVIIDVLDHDSLIRIESKSVRKTWNNLLGLERLSETAAKDILIAQVLWPSAIMETVDSLNPDVLSKFFVRELLCRRWNPKNSKITEEDDDATCSLYS